MLSESSSIRSLGRSAARDARNHMIARRLESIGVDLGVHGKFRGMPLVSLCPDSRIELGDRFELVSNNKWSGLGVMHPVILRTLAARACITVGPDAGMTGATLVSLSAITIGRGVLIGADALIIDSDFHPLRSPARRYAPSPLPRESDEIVIGDNVFIGARAIILKGVTIGENAIVGAGAIIRRDVSAGSIAT